MVYKLALALFFTCASVASAVCPTGQWCAAWNYTQPVDQTTQTTLPATSFKVYYQANCTGAFTLKAQVGATQATGSFTQLWTDTQPPVGVTTCTYVTAYNDPMQKESTPSNTVQFLLSPAPPMAPTQYRMQP